MKKVLLIGLGGTGCSVVSKVKQMVSEAEERYGKDPSIAIRFLGFDTDSNQKDAPDLDIIYTSRDSSVRNLLRGEKNYEEWFPYHPMLLPHNMLKGAGQIRVLSRLAFSDTMRHPNALLKLEEALRYLNSEKGERSDGIKIMIVSSFAGGTGSGMFLQIPLFLRSYIEKHYPGMQILIRGLFALPDVFMGHALSEIQRESMYANAYAALKELAAFNKICLSSDPTMKQYDLKIGDLFDSKKILEDERSGSLSKKPKAGRKPYDFIFFMDNVNFNRNELTDQTNVYVYREEMAKITYMQVFAPLMDTTDSREDNLIATMMITEGEAMYGSAGSAKMVYPYKDILDYCSYRTVKELVDNQWRYIDDYCKQLILNQKAKQATDRTIQVSSFAETFITEVEQLIAGKNAVFNFLPLDTQDVEVKDGKKVSQITKRQDTQFNNIHDFIEESYDQDHILKALYEKVAQEEDDGDGLGSGKSEVEDAIEEKEISLKNYYDGINERVSMRATAIANAIMPQELNGPDDDGSKPYNIRNMLERKTEKGSCAVHPLSARYLLYTLRKKIVDTKNEIEKTAKGDLSTIKAYWSADRNPRTKEIREKWYDVVPKTPISRKLFVAKYKAESKRQLARLHAYGQRLMIDEVYTILAERLSALISRYEKVFGELEKVSENLEQHSNALEHRYESDGASEIYLCASPDMMQEAFEHLTPLETRDEENDIYSALFTEVYHDAMTDLERKKLSRIQAGRIDNEFLKKMLSQSVLDMFIQRIVPHYRDQLSKNSDGAINLSVYEALEKQAAFNAKERAMNERRYEAISSDDIATARRDLLTRVYRKAAPYLLCDEYHDPDPDVVLDDGHTNMLDSLYWGLSKDVHEKIKKINANPVTYMTPRGSYAPELDVNPIYSDYELCCYRALYSVRLSEIPKFQESEDPEYQGEFYKHYTIRVEKMQQGRFGRTEEGITPHLDRRWHTRQFLPMISGAKDTSDDKRAARAMWLAYLTQNIRQHPQKKNYWVYFMPYRKNTRIKEIGKFRQRQLLCDGEPILHLDKVYDVYKAFRQDPLMVSQTLETLEPVLEQNAEQLASAAVFDLVGPRGIPLTDALIGITSMESDALVYDADKNSEEQELDQYVTDTGFKPNALKLMDCVIKHRTASEEDKMIIMETLWEIIKNLSNGMGERDEEFLLRIFSNSPYIKKVNRALANEIVLQPYFYHTMERYDAIHSRKKEPSSARTFKESPSSKKVSTKKSSPKANSAKKSVTRNSAAKKS